MSQDRSHGMRDDVRRGRQLLVVPLITAAFVMAFAITDARAQKPVAEPGACSFELLDLDVDFQPTGTPATIYLQHSASVSLLFSAESLTSEGQRIDVRYSIDGGQPEVLGPEFFSTDTVDFATRTSGP